MSRYRIADEPRPSVLSHLAVAPFWPLLGLMLAGGWLAWPWFAFNGLVMGSASKWKELGLVLAGIVGSIAVAVGVVVAIEASSVKVDDTVVRLAFVAVTLWKLAVGYAIYHQQSRSAELFEYFSGRLRNGMIVVIVGGFVLDKKITELLGATIFGMALR